LKNTLYSEASPSLEGFPTFAKATVDRRRAGRSDKSKIIRTLAPSYPPAYAF